MSRWQDKEERTVQLFAQAEEVIRQAFADGSGLREFLDFRNRVSGYSAHNTAMIKAQAPAAQMVGSFRYWKSQGLYVHLGERGAAILMPAGNGNGHTAFQLGYVFDITQTNAGENKKKELLSAKAAPHGSGDEERLLTAVYAVAEEQGITGKLPKMKNGVSELFRLLAQSRLEQDGSWTETQVLLQAEIVQYMMCRRYELKISDALFEGIAQQEVAALKIAEKRKLLQGAFRVGDSLNGQIQTCLEENRIPDKLPREKSFSQSVPGMQAENPVPAAGGQQDPGARKGRIEDFGNKIGGARKDLWRARGLMTEDLLEMNDAERSEYVTKDNIWKKPDYLALIKSGTPKRVAYFIKQVRNALPAKVTSSVLDEPEQLHKRQEDYISLIRDVREQLESLNSDRDICSFFDNFVRTGKYLERVSAYQVRTTEAGRMITNRLIRAMQVNAAGLNRLDYRMEKEQFGVSAEERLPKGFSVRYLEQRQEYVLLKGRKIVAEGMKDKQEAVETAKKMGKSEATQRKKRFVPEQLAHIVRTGPSNGIHADRPANGDMYLRDFGFYGGEFGNWMNDQDRQASLDMGYDALYDLAYALKISPADIALGGRLSIAFGARGRGNALAHYEPLREVINLTKMHGAGSLAHEWGHALDDIMGKRLGMGKYMTECYPDKRIPETMQKLLDTMKYRPVTEEERRKLNEQGINRAQGFFDRTMQLLIPEERLSDDMAERWQQLKEEVKNRAETGSRNIEGEERNERGRISWIEDKIEEISAFRKIAVGHVIAKDSRQNLYYTIYQLECEFSGIRKDMKVKTDYYNNSIRADKLYGKEDKGYWHSDTEMFARAFACYVHDRIPWRSDYLCGHSESAVMYDCTKQEAELIAAIPQGEERKRLNQCFDALFLELKEKELLKAADKKETEREQEREAAADMEGEAQVFLRQKRARSR